MKTPKTYRYKNKLLTIKQIMEQSHVNLSLKAIYNRINKAEIPENGSVTQLLAPKKTVKAVKKQASGVKKYRYKNKLMTIREIMEEPEINFTHKAIYNRISKAQVSHGGSVTKLLRVKDQRIKPESNDSNIHAQRNQLKAIKERMSVTWDELADKFKMKPRTFANYRLPSSSKEYRPFKQRHIDKVAQLNKALKAKK